MKPGEMMYLGAHDKYAPYHPIAEAVKGLANDRSALIKELQETNNCWRGYDDFKKEQLQRILDIDIRIDRLIMMDRSSNYILTKGAVNE